MKFEDMANWTEEQLKMKLFVLLMNARKNSI